MRQGAAAVELVLILPILLLLAVAGVDVARSIDTSMVIQQAALAGARRAMVPAATDKNIRDAASAAAAPLAPTVTVTRGADSVIVKVDFNLDAVTPFAGLVWKNRSVPISKRSVALVP